MSEPPEDVLLSTGEDNSTDTGKNWFGYKYLGPGTDVRHHVRNNVAPVDRLDAAARQHDIVYSNIRHLYESGKLSGDKALDLVDKYDWRLANRAAVAGYKNVLSLGMLKDLATFNPNALGRIVKAYPALYTSTAMRAKVLLSKLGIGRGSFAGIPRRKRVDPLAPSQRRSRRR